jgi:hypothetical protein
MQLSVPFDMPADYQGNILISYWKGKTPPPLGANIEPFVSIPAKPPSAPGEAAAA